MTETPNADAILIRYYSLKSPQEIGDLTGIDPAEVMRRTKTLLGTRDYLGESAKIGAILFRMESLFAELEGRMEDASNRDVAAIANSAAGLGGRMLAEMRKLREEAQNDAEIALQSYSRKFVDLIERAYYTQLGKLSERYPKVDQAELKEEFQDVILEISAEMDEKFL